MPKCDEGEWALPRTSRMKQDDVEPQKHAEHAPRGLIAPAAQHLLVAGVDVAEHRRRRATADLYRRTLWGAAFCALGCAITASVGGYFREHRELTAAVLLAFGFLQWMRWAHRPPRDIADVTHGRRWASGHWWLVLATSAVWCGFLFAVGVIEHSGNTTFFVAAMVTVAFTSASAESLALDRCWAFATVSLQQLPALLALWITLPGLRSIVLVLLAFWVYQALHISRRAKEYDTQMEIESNLLSSRAEIERLSRQDSLTGLSNRRDYEQAFETLWRHASRERKELALLVIDLDHFKSINDRYGHSGGDACLRHVAGLIREEFRRASDVPARIGGEEFAVVLPATNTAQANALAQRLCDRLATSPMLFNGHRVTVTASIGVGTMNWETDSSPQASFSRVDAACYAAKSQGRNRVVSA